MGIQLSLLPKGSKPEWEGLHLTQYFLFVRSPGKHNFEHFCDFVIALQNSERTTPSRHLFYFASFFTKGGSVVLHFSFEK